MGFSDAGILRIKRIFHMVSPVVLKIIPTMGSRGIKGQSIISIRLKILPIMMINVPASNKTRREIKPMKRDTSRSINMWNLISSEAVLEADAAEIWR